MSKLRQAAEQEPVECMCGICKLGKREWVGLTDEEIEEMHYKIKAQNMGSYKAQDIYRAIEAKLKEKNT